jgi:hypothetical protein
MKNLSALILAALALPAAFTLSAAVPSQVDRQAQIEAVRSNVQAKKSEWNALTPDQQAAKKAEAKQNAQAKKSAWQAMTPDEKAAKRTTAKARIQAARGSRTK